LRDELRLSDNRALAAAAATGQPLLAIYVHDEKSPGLRPLGGASRWWLHRSLAALDLSLRKAGGELLIFQGAAGALVPKLAQAVGATQVLWSRRYGGPEREIETTVKTSLKTRGIGADSTNDRLLVAPWEVATKSGEPFRVFTPFWRAVRERGEPAPPSPKPRKLAQADVQLPRGLEPVGLASLSGLSWSGLSRPSISQLGPKFEDG
jgi:deoxyribodipyrimidine photo-lyase